MQFEHLRARRRNATVVDLYTTADGRSYVGRERREDLWTRVATVGANGEDSVTEFVLDAPVTMGPGDRR